MSSLHVESISGVTLKCTKSIFGALSCPFKEDGKMIEILRVAGAHTIGAAIDAGKPYTRSA
jgi:hypothetical protein